MNDEDTCNRFPRIIEFASLYLYIGDKTLYILTFHFLSFKSVSYM